MLAVARTAQAVVARLAGAMVEVMAMADATAATPVLALREMAAWVAARWEAKKVTAARPALIELSRRIRCRRRHFRGRSRLP